MAYFSNGTEGEIYEDQYCSKCVNMPSDEVGMIERCCPVWLVHLVYNYQRDAYGDILDSLIPRNGTVNEMCLMFAPRGDSRNEDQRVLVVDRETAINFWVANHE